MTAEKLRLVTTAPEATGEGLALSHALDSVSALTDAGMLAVPVKPSMRMLTDGARAGGISVERAFDVYLAMLRAAD